MTTASRGQVTAKASQTALRAERLLQHGRYAEAEVLFRKVLTILPHSNVLLSLGAALFEQGKYAEARGCFERAKADPERVSASDGFLAFRFLTEWHLLHGQFREGWSYARQTCELQHRTSEFPFPLWRGESLEGKTLLLHFKSSFRHGLGDTIQFARFFPLLGTEAKRLVVVVPEPVYEIFKRCKTNKRCENILLSAKDDTTKLLNIDFWAPLFGVPMLLGANLENIPRDVPYLWPRLELIERWRLELPPSPCFRAGIVWQGSPDAKGRSVPLWRFTALSRIPGVKLISLQVGSAAKQIRDVDFPVIDFGSRFNPACMTDAAAAITTLDLVITIDSAIAHLAGALGRPVWVVLPFAPDWRWLLGRDDSPWYPSMRLFRQERLHDLAGAFRRVAAELARLVHEPGRGAGSHIPGSPPD